MHIVGILLAFMAGAMVIGALLHATVLKNKKESITPSGTLVSVFDGQMHVRSMGSGDQTIVLLPGMGVGLPSVDFAPLMRTLSNDYTVVIVEYFGTGFSSTTSRARTSAAYAEEIRTALSQAGFEPPYVLMPHSISSVYSEHYASTHPGEVSAIISLDGTSTAYYAPMPGIVKAVLPIASFQQAIGMTALLATLTTSKTKLHSYGFTDDEISDLVAFAGFTMNRTMLEQIAQSGEAIKQTMALPFPPSVPYLKLIARKTYETPNKQLPMGPQEYQNQHLQRIGVHAQSEILEGNHFIYLNNALQITSITNKFLAALHR